MKKDELIRQLEDEHDNFLELIEDLPDEILLKTGVIDNWSIKDIIAHITMWEAQLVTFLWQAKQGQKPNTAQLSSISEDELNQKWYLQNVTRGLEQILEDFYAIRTQTIRRVQPFSEHELNDPKRFAWLKGKTLITIIAESSFAHEAEHADQIRSWIKLHTA